MTLTLSLTLITTLLGAPTAPMLKDSALYAAPKAAVDQTFAPQASTERFSVRLRCTALASGHVTDCVVLEETRPGLGFGEAALALMDGAEVTPILERGRAVDAPFERTIDFTP
ncbi:energy transducer TonB family protein [Brevundimonas sp. DWR2-3-1b1]|uniref:energy transducer TonB family protein n=1 Tax=unclassified Brevundimonas TaxID=2622653 RepID=UPI003CF6D175